MCCDLFGFAQERSPACGAADVVSAAAADRSSSRLHHSFSGRTCATACQRPGFTLLQTGAGGQRRDNLMKTKRALSIKPHASKPLEWKLKQNYMGFDDHDF